MRFFRRIKKQPSVPFLFDGPHWQVQPVRDLKVFFDNLLRLLPEGAILCLAKSAWSKEGRAFVHDYALPPSEPHPLGKDFARAPGFAVNDKIMALLSQMATRHAEPELALHIGVHAHGVALLEWYDLPYDPISVSPTIAEVRVAKFAGACGVNYAAK